MDFSVLTSDFRVQLEQQRDRLLSERDGIVQAAVEQATITINANLAHINALLGNTDAATSGTTTPVVHKATRGKQKKAATLDVAIDAQDPSNENTSPARATKAPKEPKAPKTPKEPKAPKVTAKEAKAATASKAPTGQPRRKLKSATIEIPQIKPEFNTDELANALPIVFKQDPTHDFTVDDVIDALYGDLSEAVLPKTRQRVAVSLGHCARREEIIKVQDYPSIYRLNA